MAEEKTPSGKPKKNFHDVPLLVTVSKVREECYRGYKEGDTFIFKDPSGFLPGGGGGAFPLPLRSHLWRRVPV